MKRLSIQLIALLLMAGLWSCEKEENRIYLEPVGEGPVLTATASNMVLRFEDSLKTALKFSWTNPEFKFTTGVSSQDVNYVLEIDTAGAEFSRPNRISLGINRELSRTMTVAELNDFVVNALALQDSVEHSLEARVKATIGTSVASAFSNVVPFKVTAYRTPPKVAPPATGRLFIIGNATPHGWGNPVPEATNELTRVSETLYETTMPLVGGGYFLLLSTNGQWDKYSVANNALAGLAEGGDFRKGDGQDFPGPAASGTYKITVDFQRGRFTVIKQ